MTRTSGSALRSRRSHEAAAQERRRSLQRTVIPELGKPGRPYEETPTMRTRMTNAPVRRLNDDKGDKGVTRIDDSMSPCGVTANGDMVTSRPGYRSQNVGVLAPRHRTTSAVEVGAPGNPGFKLYVPIPCHLVTPTAKSAVTSPCHSLVTALSSPRSSLPRPLCRHYC